MYGMLAKPNCARTQGLEQFMESLGLSKYAQVLKQQEFADPEALVLLTDEDLKEMQVLVSGAHVCRSWGFCLVSRRFCGCLFMSLVTIADRHTDTRTQYIHTHSLTHSRTHTQVTIGARRKLLAAIKRVQKPAAS